MHSWKDLTAGKERGVPLLACGSFAGMFPLNLLSSLDSGKRGLVSGMGPREPVAGALAWWLDVLNCPLSDLPLRVCFLCGSGRSSRSRLLLLCATPAESIRMDMKQSLQPLARDQLPCTV